MSEVTVINIVLAVILCFGLIVGYRRGFLRQVLELIGIVASFVLALLFAGGLAAMLDNRFDIPYTPALVIAFVAIFIGTVIAFHFIAVTFQRIIRMTLLGWVDRLTGAMLGIIMGMLVASLLIHLALELPLPKRVQFGFDQSRFSHFLEPVAPRIFNLILDHGNRKVNFEKIFNRSDTA